MGLIPICSYYLRRRIEMDQVLFWCISLEPLPFLYLYGQTALLSKYRCVQDPFASGMTLNGVLTWLTRYNHVSCTSVQSSDYVLIFLGLRFMSHYLTTQNTVSVIVSYCYPHFYLLYIHAINT